MAVLDAVVAASVPPAAPLIDMEKVSSVSSSYKSNSRWPRGLAILSTTVVVV